MQKLIFLVALCAALVSCGGGGSSAVAVDPGPVDSCSAGAQRASLDAWLQDQYYWYTQLGAPNVGAADLDTYFHSQLPNPPDRYSFSTSTASQDQTLVGGWRIGYGYTLTWDDDGARLRVRNIEPQSPAATVDIHRGDTVVSIDGYTPQQVMAGALPTVNTAGVDRTFVLADASGAQRSVTVRSALFALTPLATWSVLDATRAGVPVKVGYMAYHQFATYSVFDLALATERMQAQGVNELVLDLRYNGGGVVGTSRDLASMISGSKTDGAIYAELRFNDRHPEENQDMPFMTAQERYTAPIEGLSRVFVITSGGTASASELLINGLRPFMPVVLVGERTYGKPYGFVSHANCGTTFNAVNFEAFNGRGEGGYASGLPADCAVPDDLDHQLGDPQERRLKEALGYIATGSCSAQAPQAADIVPKRPRVFGETAPPQMFLR